MIDRAHAAVSNTYLHEDTGGGTPYIGYPQQGLRKKVLELHKRMLEKGVMIAPMAACPKLLAAVWKMQSLFFRLLRHISSTSERQAHILEVWREVCYLLSDKMAIQLFD